MTQIDQIIADALAGSPETHVAILAREVARLREPPAVVVPELTDRDLYDTWLKCDYGLEEEPIYHEGVRDGYKLAVSRARSIPADRVLGEGMVGVDREELIALETLEKLYRGTARPSREMNAMVLRLDALRANQGGVNHD